MANPLPQPTTTEIESLRAFSGIKLVALDLDGTVLRSASAALSTTIALLRSRLKHKRYDVTVLLATGRTFSGVKAVVDELYVRTSDAPLILYNGSLAVLHRSHEILWHRTIHRNALEQMISLATPVCAPILAYYYGTPFSYGLSLPEAKEFVLGWTGERTYLTEFNGLPVNWQRDEKCALYTGPTAVLIDTTALDREKRELLLHSLESVPEITLANRRAAVVEIRPTGSTKAEALAAVSKHLGVQQEQTLALGDNDNDAEMLAWAGVGVAVANASELAIAASDYSCAREATEGAIEVLRLIKTARRYASAWGN